MEKTEELGRKIKEIREKKNLSQERFGKKIGKSGKTISAYEKGRCTPPLKVLDSIVETYDVTFSSLKSGRRAQLEEKLQYIKNAIEEIESTFLARKEGL